MTQDFEIIYAEKMDENYLKKTVEILDAHAKESRGFAPAKLFSFTITDKNQNFIAGIEGAIFFCAMYIELLAVDEQFRGQNYGTVLMEKAEELAKEKKCLFITLITMDFQAKPFYEKFGYRLEFTRVGYPYDSIMYYLRKDL